MKIILEFKSKFEHDKYCCDQVTMMERARDGGVATPDVGFGKPIGDYSRKKYWSEIDLAFLKENYMSKKVTWIAKQLRRKPTAVYQMLNKMYANGLPKKRPVNGEVIDS